LNDGLKLHNLYITAGVRCAPPDNRPLPQELAECSTFLDREIAGFRNLRVIVALGKIGFDAYLNYVKRRALIASKKTYSQADGGCASLTRVGCKPLQAVSR
jgi:uracil-DNA glycosylase family 4